MKINKCCEKLEYKLHNSTWNESITAVKAMLNRKKHKVLYMGVPTHPNMGDQAQAICIQQWIREYYPNSEIIEFPTRSITRNDGEILKKIAKYVAPSDLILFQSGYTITDLYPENEKMHYLVLSMFPNNTVVFFPQTVFFSDSEEGRQALEKSKAMLNGHKKTILLCRDQISFQHAQEYYPACKTYLYPDIVTTKIGQGTPAFHREGVLLCLRNDKEKFYSDAQLKLLYQKVSQKETCTTIDTTITGENNYELSRHRKKYFEQMLSVFAKAEVVITDRYHGVIFSLITSTPVIVLKTSDHKLSSGVLWYESICDSYICMADSIEDAIAKKDAIDRKQPEIHTEVFKNYYSELKQLIFNLDP